MRLAGKDMPAKSQPRPPSRGLSHRNVQSRGFDRPQSGPGSRAYRSTRFPAAMHTQYLRTCYVENRLVRPGAFTADGTPVDIGAIETPLYVLGAEADHIAPWRSTYQTTQLASSPSQYVLSFSGHIASTVNPPGNPKSWYATRDDCPPDADEWLAGAARAQGTWWEHWADWAAERSGERVPPPTLPADEPAPAR